MPVTGTGVAAIVEIDGRTPSPRNPEPQHLIVPSVSSAQVGLTPSFVLIAFALSIPGTLCGMGDSSSACPGEPYAFSMWPQHLTPPPETNAQVW
jgi:hypothetical protein